MATIAGKVINSLLINQLILTSRKNIAAYPRSMDGISGRRAWPEQTAVGIEFMKFVRDK
jgi:hypothetical protein